MKTPSSLIPRCPQRNKTLFTFHSDDGDSLTTRLNGLGLSGLVFCGSMEPFPKWAEICLPLVVGTIAVGVVVSTLAHCKIPTAAIQTSAAQWEIVGH